MKFESGDIVFTPITSLLSGVIDNRGRTCPTEKKGIPLIATNCIGNENLYPVKKNIRYVSLETYNTWFRGHPEPGDVIFVNKGTPGRVCLVPDPIDFCIAQDMVSLRVNEHINNLYLLAAIRAPQVQNQIQQMQVGTMIPHFKKGDFEKLLIPMRDMPTQKAIGKLYFELSQKVDLNERTSKTLESIAQTIFKSWFIDFDPVEAKMAGEKPVGMDVETVALFPDSMEESELGLIPKSWEILQSTDLFDVLSGGTPKTSNEDYWKGDIPWFSVVDAPDSGGCFFIKTTKTITKEGFDNSAAKLVRPGVTVISARGTVGKTAIVAIPSTFNQSCYGIEGKYGDFFTYLLLQNQIARLQNISHGGMFDTITRDTFSAIKVAKPQTEIIKNFESLVSPIFLEIRSLQFQSDNLVRIRDSLLPRLISGELQIPEEMLAS